MAASVELRGNRYSQASRPHAPPHGQQLHSAILTVFGSARMQVQPPLISSDQLLDILYGTVFVFAGLAACCIAAMRRWSGMRTILWLGLWSAMYGAKPLANSLAAVAYLPHWFRVCLPYLDTVNAYFI